ncbi:flagellar hook-basal body complex protein FliE [Clostridium sp.]|uniref:flagellar hook-basal body complex protein FliE n=1 Tax=Clostridium sp. TaxID=1506 RepID=UPI00262CCA75|nr:flagellar hook-basal body complex protein FliE [Clostridium sp.]
MRIEDNFLRSEALFNNKFLKSDNNDKSTETSTSNVSFGDVLKSYVDDTNNKMTQSDSATTSFIKGDDVSIDDVMIKNQEASLSLQFLTQTRDKLLDGYNQLIKTQL